jgi:hypothetical protein
MTGEIDGHQLEIRGVVVRKPPAANGPCMFCEKMLNLGSSDRMILEDTRCRWAGEGRRGHIQQFPPELKTTIDANDFLTKMKEHRVVYRRAAKCKV